MSRPDPGLNLGLDAAARAYLEALPAEQRRVLTEAVREAEARQRRRVERAIEQAVHHVPLVLRGVVRRWLMG